MPDVNLPPGVTVDAKYLEDFWRFVCERQSIWYRRFVKNKPKPWTKDPILQDYFFTNVYRELDAGTQFYMQHVGSISNPRDRLFNTLAYRYFNHEPTWLHILETFGDSFIPLGKWDHKKMAQVLTRWEDEGHQIFTPAFTVTGVRFGGYPDKISNVCWLVEHLQSITPITLRKLFLARNLRDVFNVCYNLLGFGAFLAYEITIDLNYNAVGWGQFSEDDFVNPGPGCQVGLQYIFPERGKVTYEFLINYLRWNQNNYFARFDLRFRRYEDRELSLRNVEHSLCEYSKYARTKWKKLPNGERAFTTTRRYSGGN